MFRILSIILLLYAPFIGAQDFDFDEEDENDTSNRLSLPLDLNISLFEARQLNPARHVKTGASLYEVFDYNRNGLRVRAESTLTFNHAFRLEEDPDAVIDEHEWEWVPRELYVSQSWGQFTFLAGKQIKVLGKTDFLSPLDIVAPKDSTQLLFASPEEARIGQNLVSLEYFKGGFSIWLAASPSPAFDRLPEPGHPYGGPPINLPEEKDDDAEAYGKVELIREDWELALVAAKTHHRSPLLGISTELSPILYFPNYSIMGLGATYVMSPVLLKLEFAHSTDYPDWAAETIISSIERHKVSFLTGGLDWNSDKWGSVLLEMSRSYASDESDFNGQLVNHSQAALSWSTNFLRETLSISGTILLIDSAANRIGRGDIAYRFTDDLEFKFSTTSIAVEGGQSALSADLSQFDRVEVSLTWDHSFSE